MSLIKILDAVEDLAEQHEDLVEAVKDLQLQAPQTHITTPPPVVNVAAPKPAAPVAWEFEVTERDHNDLILKFTATPIRR